VVVFLLLQPFFNWIFGLGSFQGLQTSIEGIRLPGWLYPIGLVGFLAIAIVGGPLGNLIFMFGEEFGWRGFLLGELEKLGRLPAALAVGLIWWAWHIPIILAGVHTYPPTLLGFSLALIFFTLWGIVQSYAVLKTRSVWTAAFIHGLVNGVYAFTLQYLVRPVDKLFSFGLGTYGLILMFLVVLWLLRDPVWRTSLTMPDSSTAVQDR
jgi:membrane protease YdiL (CAAX protease family)